MTTTRRHQPRDVPPGAGDDPPHLARRDEQVLKPRRSSLAVTNAKAKLTGEAPALAIQPVVAPMIGVGALVGISGFGENSSCRRREVPEAPEKPPSSAGVAEQPEIVAEHDDGVELAELAAHLGDWKDARVAHPAQAASPDGEGRPVDRDHPVAPRLKMQRHTTGAAADIEGSAPRVPNGPLLMRGPHLVGGRSRQERRWRHQASHRHVR